MIEKSKQMLLFTWTILLFILLFSTLTFLWLWNRQESSGLTYRAIHIAERIVQLETPMEKEEALFQLRGVNKELAYIFIHHEGIFHLAKVYFSNERLKKFIKERMSQYPSNTPSPTKYHLQKNRNSTTNIENNKKSNLNNSSILSFKKNHLLIISIPITGKYVNPSSEPYIVEMGFYYRTLWDKPTALILFFLIAIPLLYPIYFLLNKKLTPLIFEEKKIVDEKRKKILKEKVKEFLDESTEILPSKKLNISQDSYESKELNEKKTIEKNDSTKTISREKTIDAISLAQKNYSISINERKKENTLEPQENHFEKPFPNITIHNDDSIFLKEKEEVPSLTPGQADIPINEKIIFYPSSPGTAFAKEESMERSKDEIAELSIDDFFRLKLGRGKENVRHAVIDLSNFSETNKDEDNHEMVVDSIPEKKSTENENYIYKFEQAIRQRSDIRSVITDILRQLKLTFPSLDCSLYLRSESQGNLLLSGTSRLIESRNQIDHNSLLFAQMINYDRGFFSTKKDCYWQPLVSNGVLVGALSFFPEKMPERKNKQIDTNNTSEKLPNESFYENLFPPFFEQKIIALAHPIALAFFHFRLFEMAITDGLTSLYSKRHFDHEIRKLYASSVDSQENACLALLDIDHFKQLNDTFGHLAGDHVLKALARLLRDSLPDGGSAYRVGGEEFALLLPYSDSKKTFSLIEKIREDFAMLIFEFNGKKTSRTISAGIAEIDINSASPNEKEMETSEKKWIHRADLALYDAKKSGRNQTIIHGQTNLPIVEFHDKANIDISTSEGFYQGVLPGV